MADVEQEAREKISGIESQKPISTIKDIDGEDYIAAGTFACSGCQPVLGIKLTLKALGKNTIMVNPSGCMTLTANHPFTPYKIPWVHNAIENADSTAAGIFMGLKRKGLEKKVNIVVYAGDGATYDIGFQALSGMFDRFENIIHVCYNNEVFANTGYQRTAATPLFARTTTTPIEKKARGNLIPRKHMTKIMLAHDSPYVATACTAYPIDFMKKLQKAAGIYGPKYIELFAPCIPGWLLDTEKGRKVGELSVQSGLWPLYEIENGKFSISMQPRMIPVKEALKIQGRYLHLNDEEIDQIQQMVNKEWESYNKGEFWTVHEY
ncbi:MAG: pyruvate synthase subunit beta [Candidatus Diapherotrites archaeon]|uniref:Pyruvate synthase subunit beta n=2 Tax=Candidatus Iainarchaeum sp. TaxID=3101447 RepID=A0A7J4JXH5_9ARCH|nr:pyruvate synthase subunit beta [Candidatus Diapherotrites archaeon]HIH21379.1 pyruvate synthase subunit beta [Candidatus Diapherotrites archaeon]